MLTRKQPLPWRYSLSIVLTTPRDACAEIRRTSYDPLSFARVGEPLGPATTSEEDCDNSEERISFEGEAN